MPKIPQSQDSQTTFKPNLTCILLRQSQLKNTHFAMSLKEMNCWEICMLLRIVISLSHIELFDKKTLCNITFIHLFLNFSLLKLDVKTKTATGVEFNSGGSSNTDSGKVTGSLETKYKCADYGMTFTEKWSTDNSLATTIELADKPLKGAKLVFDSTFSPQTGKFLLI